MLGDLSIVVNLPLDQHCIELLVQERDGAHAEGKSHFESSGRKMSRDAGLMSGQVSAGGGGRSAERLMCGLEAPQGRAGLVRRPKMRPRWACREL